MFGEDFLKTLGAWAANAAVRIVLAIVTMVIGVLLIKLIVKLVSKSKWLQKADKTVAKYAVTGIKALLYIILVISVVAILGVPMASMVAVLASCGVAIGLAALGARELGGEMGRALETIILSSSVLYELIGPGASKLSLWLSGSYSNELEEMASVPEITETGEKKTELELLIERIQKIQEELPEHTENENERAFTEAAEEYYREQTQAQNLRPRRPGIRRGPF